MSAQDKNMIMIPVKLKAWVVSDAAVRDLGRYKDMALDYGDINTFNGTRLEKNDVFYTQPLRSADKGVHLHWSLPVVFTHGIQHGDDIHFPPVPNRWLVNRFWVAEDKLQSRSWIVESDYIGDDGTNSWITIDDRGEFKPRFIGRSMPLDQWSESGLIPDQPLTAVAPGDPMFSASYHSCRNVFGFHDAETVAGIEYTYSVAGWYSKPKLDPLNEAHSGFLENMAGLWNRRKEFTEANCRLATFINHKVDERNFSITKDTHSLCHAAIHRVKIDASDPGDRFEKQQVSFTIANNIKEAFAVQLAHKTGNAEAEPLIAALVNNYLKDVASLTEMEAMQHEQGFEPLDGGYEWEIITKTNDAQQDKKAIKDFPDEASFKVPEDYKKFLQAFTLLNEGQEEWNQLLRTKENVTAQIREAVDTLNLLFAEFAETETTFDRAAMETFDNFIAFVEQKVPLYKDVCMALGSNILSLGAELEEIRDKEAKFKDAICKTRTETDGSVKIEHGKLGLSIISLLQNCKPSENSIYELSRKQMPGFWKPHQPTVLLSMDGEKERSPAYVPEAGYKLKPVLCRELPSFITTAYYDHNNPATTALPEILPGLSKLEDSLKTCIRGICAEVLMTGHIASQFLDEAKTGNAVANIAGFFTQGKAGHINYGINNGQLVTLEKVSTDDRIKILHLLGAANYSDSWQPLYMLWGLDWHPDYSLTDAGAYHYDAEKWKLTKEFKLDRQAALSGSIPPVKLGYTGYNLLTPVDAEQLLGEKGKLLKDKDKVYFAQTLSGFNDNLLMKTPAANIPVFNSPAAKFKDFLPAGDLANINDYAPCNITPAQLRDGLSSLPVFPVRAGAAKFKNLWLTDNFGRVKRIITKREKKDGALSPLTALAMSGLKDKEAFILPPRIVSPARLDFRLKPVKDTANSTTVTPDASSTPVFGWFVLNNFNNSLYVFNNGSALLGELMFKEADKSFLWRTETQISAVTGDDVAKKLSAYPQVGALVKHIVNLPGQWDFFNLTIATVAASINSAGGAKTPELSHLMGIPLALVNASIGIQELRSAALPAWLPVKGDVEVDAIVKQRFDTKLGDKHHRKDGLVGYFVSDEPGKFYSQYTKAGTTFFHQEQLKLSSGSSKKLSLLIHPDAGVTAFSGILPAQHLELPAMIVNKGLKNLEFSFLAAPLITAEKEPMFIVNEEPGNRWSWLDISTVDKKQDITKIAPNKNGEQLEGAFLKQQIREGYLRLEKDK